MPVNLFGFSAPEGLPEENANLPIQDSTAPVSEPGDDTSENPYGPNNEELPEHLQAELKRLMDAFILEDSISRHAEVRQIRKQREFWRNRQYLYWSDQDQTWKIPSTDPLDPFKLDEPLYQYVTNIFQAYGLIFTAAVTTNPPHVRFWPQSIREETDMATARAASSISEFIERNNRLSLLLQDIAFYLWTDGTVFSYVRYVVDGERFGYREESIMGEEVQQIEDGTWAPVPVETGVQRIPNGQERIDVFGRLEIKVPNYAREQSEYPYLIWSTEIHKAKLFSVYPHAAENIRAGADTAEDEWERNARVGLTSSRESSFGSSGDHESLVTFRRCWLRPWTFTQCEPGVRAELEQVFPDGAYVAFAGDTYCESRNECMDYYWTGCHGLPGDGQARDAVGTPAISLQERYNTMSNIVQETYEYGIPTTFFDAQAIDGEAWAAQGNRPGSRMPVRRNPGESLNQIVETTRSGTPPESLVQYLNDIMGPVAQMVLGLYPALFGASTDQDTASGYAMQRDQAMGRIGLIYRRIKEFHAETMLNAVECFKKNRSGEVELAVLGPAGQLDAKMINLDEIRGSVLAYPETDEDYPVSWTARKNVMLDMLQNPNPAVMQFFQDPSNLVNMTKDLGVALKAPGEQARMQQYREIRKLLEEAPMQIPPPMDPRTGLTAVDPMSGAPIQPQLATSIQIDPILDNHQAHLLAIQEWAESDEGQMTKESNPVGYQNVRLHAEAHQAYLMQTMMAQQQAAQSQSGSQPPSHQEDEPPAEAPLQ